MPRYSASVFLHLIFSTKDREPFLREDIRKEVFAFMASIAQTRRVEVVAINGVSDHVHLVLMPRVDMATSDLVRTLKAVSSKWIRNRFRDLPHFGWQSGYGVYSVSRSNLDAVFQYVANQEEHHKTMTYEEEYSALAKKHRYRSKALHKRRPR